MKRSQPIRTAAPILILLAGIGLPVFFGACGGSEDVVAERARRAGQGGGELLIGAAWPWAERSEGHYAEGLAMAVEELNAGGGVLGRSLRLVKEDDHESVNEGRLVAQRFADDPDIVAVIGHLNSHVSIPAAPIYEAAGLLMLTPASTSPELTEGGYRRIFRTVNTDEKIGHQMAAYAQGHGYQRVAICYVRNEYGLGLANAFERHAADTGIQIADRQSYDPASRSAPASFQRIVDEWKDLNFDAVFLAGMAPEAGHFVRQVRQSGITAPIFGGDALDTMELIQAAGPSAEGVVVATIFHPDNPEPAAQAFAEAFERRYGMRPDSWAARGYEAVHLLAHAIEQAGTAAPDRVADALRQMDRYSGLNGAFGFDEKGDVVGKSLVTVVVRDGRFAFLNESRVAQAGTRTVAAR